MSAATTTVRGMRWPDLGAVADLEAVVHPQDAWSPQTWWAELAQRPRRDYVVLTDEAGTAVLGYGGVDLSTDTADLMTLVVDPALRGGGHGQALLVHLHARALAAGATAILLEVREDNHAARRLYARTGYTQVHRRRGYYQPAGVDALVLRRELGPATTGPTP